MDDTRDYVIDDMSADLAESEKALRPPEGWDDVVASGRVADVARWCMGFEYGVAAKAVGDLASPCGPAL